MIHIRSSPIISDAIIESLCGIDLAGRILTISQDNATDEPMPTTVLADVRCPACWRIWRAKGADAMRTLPTI